MQILTQTKMIGLLAFVFFSFMTGCKNTPVEVLLFSGRNNHNWQETTPMIQDVLEKSGRFKVTVTENPEALDPGKLDTYQVILSNWNTWPEVTGHRWNPDLEKAFLRFIADGKGFVVIHAGSSTLQDWPEFQKIAGGTWALDSTGHGPIHTFKVTMEDKNHPVTNGLNDFYIKDELWHRTQFQPGIHVLCRAYSSPEYKGTGKDEPVVITTHYGKGRGFYCVLGHNKATMQNTGWQTLLLRGTEWAATGEVTIPAEAPWPSSAEKAEEQSK